MGSKKTKYCMVMTHALVIFSLSPRLGIWGVSLELMGIGVVSWINEVNVHVNTCTIHFGDNSCVCPCVFLCVWLRPWQWVRGRWQERYGSYLSIIIPHLYMYFSPHILNHNS